MATVLGIDVDDALLASWADWLAPAVQPFLVENDSDWPTVGEQVVTPESRDTFRLWRTDRALEMVWMDEAMFNSLEQVDRARLVRQQVVARRGAVATVRAWCDLVDARALADGHRFVWWPSLMKQNARQIVTRYVEGEGPPSQHKGVPAATLRTLPGVAAIAGTFANGANCFGTVMTAAGVDGVALEWVVREPFEEWLGASCRPGGNDHDPGTVFVWRNHDGLAQHAAITLGDGWALEKPSQCWWTPRHVQPVRNLLKMNRMVGQRMTRYRLT